MSIWTQKGQANRENSCKMEHSGLPKEAIHSINRVFSKYTEVESVLMYGSRAMGTHKPASDIDLALKGESLDLSLQTKIEHDLDDLLLPQRFDISIFHKLSNPDLVDHINKAGLEIYKRKDSKLSAKQCE